MLVMLWRLLAPALSSAELSRLILQSEREGLDKRGQLNMCKAEIMRRKQERELTVCVSIFYLFPKKKTNNIDSLPSVVEWFRSFEKFCALKAKNWKNIALKTTVLPLENVWQQSKEETVGHKKKSNQTVLYKRCHNLWWCDAASLPWKARKSLPLIRNRILEFFERQLQQTQQCFSRNSLDCFSRTMPGLILVQMTQGWLCIHNVLLACSQGGFLQRI